jgi:hypothetical protein
MFYGRCTNQTFTVKFIAFWDVMLHSLVHVYHLLSPSSGLNVADCSMMFVNVLQSTEHHITEDSNLQCTNYVMMILIMWQEATFMACSLILKIE